MILFHQMSEFEPVDDRGDIYSQRPRHRIFLPQKRRIMLECPVKPVNRLDLLCLEPSSSHGGLMRYSRRYHTCISPQVPQTDLNLHTHTPLPHHRYTHPKIPSVSQSVTSN